MGRQAGLTAEAAERRILDAAGRVFAERGYDGTRISDVAEEAGLTSGAIYNHFGSKAGLLRAVIDARAGSVLAELLSAHAGESTVEAFRAAATGLPATGRPVLLEALVASRRDDEVREAVRTRFVDAEGAVADLIAAAAETGDIDPELDTGAIARLVLTFSMGAASLSVLDLDEVDPRHWARLVDRLLTATAP